MYRVGSWWGNEPPGARCRRIYRSPDPPRYSQYIKTLHTHDAGPLGCAQSLEGGQGWVARRVEVTAASHYAAFAFGFDTLVALTTFLRRAFVNFLSETSTKHTTPRDVCRVHTEHTPPLCPHGYSLIDDSRSHARRAPCPHHVVTTRYINLSKNDDYESDVYRP